eukprot:gnl/TRDRNA2_/TRDRNA2_165967_c1_seq2.p1 gnl/TRDRNA2_/TRDRNA2_165967_c1~~gnl/TRDRNA2_/TRDRNA2_165967_c1_seq2.p1  ORF type:complete len:191 (+),score=19.56 gnl/TRDRNA2_/TRDRNA2_165967_c1_seq2:39-575(+)
MTAARGTVSANSAASAREYASGVSARLQPAEPPQESTNWFASLVNSVGCCVSRSADVPDVDSSKTPRPTARRTPVHSSTENAPKDSTASQTIAVGSRKNKSIEFESSSKPRQQTSESEALQTPRLPENAGVRPPFIPGMLMPPKHSECSNLDIECCASRTAVHDSTTPPPTRRPRATC